MNDCIEVKAKGKKIQYTHLPVYNGAGESVHCIFCMKQWETRVLALAEVEDCEDYPGQDYFWRVNPNIKKAEENWYGRNVAGVSENKASSG
jgi:hypothetical protein